jgi:hypothetical protein
LGDYHVRELFLYEKDFGSMAFGLVGVGFRSLVIALAEGLHDWGRWTVPLLNYALSFDLQLRKTWKTSVRIAEQLRE